MSSSATEDRRPSKEPGVGAIARPLPMLANSVSVMLGKSSTMALGFLFWVVAARQFAPDQVGLAAAAVSAMMLCTQLALLGVGSAVITKLPEHLHRPAPLLNTAFTLVATTAAIIGGAFLILAGEALPRLGAITGTPLFATLFLVMTVLGTLSIAFDQVSIALRRGDQVLVRGLAFGVMTLALIVVLPRVTGADSAVLIVSPWVTAGAAVAAIAALQLWRSLDRYRYRPELGRDQASILVAVGLPNWLLTLTERVPGLLLPIVVTELLAPAANATWYAAWMMAWAVFIVPISAGLALFAEISNRPDSIEAAVSRAVRSSLALGLAAAAAVALVAPHLLSLLGAEYAAAGATPLRILVLGVLPLCIVQAYFATCRARHTLGEAIVTGTVSGVTAVVAASAAGVVSGLVGMAIAWLAVQTATAAWAALRLRALTRAPAPGIEQVAASPPAPRSADPQDDRLRRPTVPVLGSELRPARRTSLGSAGAMTGRSFSVPPSWFARGTLHAQAQAPALVDPTTDSAPPVGGSAEDRSNVIHLSDRGLELPGGTPGTELEIATRLLSVRHDPVSGLGTRRRSDLAALAAILESYVGGVSTHAGEGVVERLGLHEVPHASVMSVCRELDHYVAAFQQRPLEGGFPYLWLATTSLPVRYGADVRPTPIAIACAVHEGGHRHLIGLDLVDLEPVEFWPQFLRSLSRRGLDGVRLTISDAYEGVRAASMQSLSSTWQLSVPHFIRTLRTRVSPTEASQVTARLMEVIGAESAERARQRLGELVDLLSDERPAASVLLEDSADDLLAHFAFPVAHRANIRTANPLVRIGAGVARRGEAVGVLPSTAAAVRLAGAVLIEQNEDWLAGRRYMAPKSLALVPEIEERPPVPSRLTMPRPLPPAFPTRAVARVPRVQVRPLGEAEAPAARSVSPVLARAYAVAIASFVALVGIVAIWALAVRAVDVGRMDDLGLVSALPLQSLGAVVLLTISFGFAVRRPSSRGMLLLAHVVVLVFMLYGLAPLLEDVPRFAVTWRHLGVTESIGRTAAIDPRIDAYFNWPGFFVLTAFLTDIAGIHDLSRVVAWAPVFFNLLYIAPLLVIMRAGTDSERLVWVATWLFFLTNWIGQDYFSPQATVFFLYLVVLAIVVRWFQKSPGFTHVPGVPPPGGYLTLGRLRGRWASLSRQDLEDLEAPPPARVRAALIALAILVTAAIVAGHQLTPFALLLGLTGLVLVGRCTARGLPVLVATLIGTWLSFMAIKYVRGHFEALVGSLGDIEQSLNSSVGGRLHGSAQHELVVRARLLMTGFVWTLALTGLVYSLRRGRPRIAFAVLAAAPLGLVAMQPYGGEVLLRAYLFGLPFVAFYAATLFAPAAGSRGSWLKSGALCLVSATLALGLLLTRYGNERMDYFTPGEVEAVNAVYESAPPGARLVAASSSLPWKFRDYEKFRYEVLADSPVWAAMKGPRPSVRRVVARTMAHLSSNRVDTYLIITRSERAQLEMLGYPSTLLSRLDRTLARAPGVRLVHRSPDGMVWHVRPLHGAAR